MISNDLGSKYTRDIKAIQLAMMLGVSVHTVRAWAASDGCPHEKMPGRTGCFLFDANEVQEWMRQSGRTGGMGRPVENGDPLLSGNGSPALEEYRRESAMLKRMDRLERERVMIPRAEIIPALFSFASKIREAGERLAREYGNGAAEVLNDAIDEAEHGWKAFAVRASIGSDADEDGVAEVACVGSAVESEDDSITNAGRR